MVVVAGPRIDPASLNAPDGVEVMSFRSNVPEIAKFTFRRFDPEYHGTAQESAPGFIVCIKR